MLRIYRYTNPYEFQEFETHLFTTLRPTFDHANDRLYIAGIDYRISTINYIGLFNRLLDNQANYTITFGELDTSWAVMSNNQNFSIALNPKLQGCVFNLKLKKTTANDLVINLPENSFGADIINNTLTLKGLENETFFLNAVYENGEFDWLSRTRIGGYGGGTYEAKGYSVTLAADVDVSSTQEALDRLFNIQSQSPLVALNTNPASGLREFGNSISGLVLTATTTKRTNPITSVVFQRNGSTIHIVPTPNPNGGNESYTDNVIVSANTTYLVTVSDGTKSSTAQRVFTFVYPFYYGVGAKNLNAAQIQALTKNIATKQNLAVTSSPTNQVYYFAYPKSYGLLVSILDKNGFETIDGYTLRELSFAMLDGTSQQYYVYEFNNYTTQVEFINNYKF